MARRSTPDPTIGERIRFRRNVLKISVRLAASRAGVSHATWSRIESGKQSADNRFTLAAMAQALRCPITELTGGSDDIGGRPTGGLTDPTETVRAAIESDLRHAPRGEPIPLPSLTLELDLVSSLRLKADYAGMLGRLPTLIRNAHAASFGAEKSSALRTLVRTAEVASFAVRNAGDPTAAVLVAERAQQAAEAVEDPVMLALAAWAQAHAATGLGLYERAFSIANQAVTDLAGHLDEPEAAELYGALLLTTAFTSAATGDLNGRDARVAEAAQIAQRTGDSDALTLTFGPTNVRIWQVSIEADAGDPEKAIEIARGTNPTRLSNAERQGTFYAETGRALARTERDTEATRMLLAAERISPQRVRRSPILQETARSLAESPRHNGLAIELRALCRRMSVPA